MSSSDSEFLHNTPEFGPVTQQTANAIIELVDQKVGHLPPCPNGTRYDEFRSQTPTRQYVWLGIRQIPVELSRGQETVFINIASADRSGNHRGDFTHYRFYPTEQGIDLVESRPGSISTTHIQYRGDANEYFNSVSNEDRRIRAEERAAGLGVVSEQAASDLLQTIRRANSLRHPKGFSWLRAILLP